jgi:hypothetical protein
MEELMKSEEAIVDIKGIFASLITLLRWFASRLL